MRKALGSFQLVVYCSEFSGKELDCIRVIKHWEEVGVDQIMLIMQTGRMPHDVITESIENFGKYVLPEFKKAEITTVA